MIRFLHDPANAITSVGLCCAVTAMWLSVSGHPGLAVAVAIWALLADHLDGVVAKRTAGRSPETGKIGKNLDAFADLVSAGIFPGVLVMSVTHGTWWAAVAAGLLAVASALRLSYFNAFGLDRDRFTGVPTTYVLPAVALIFLFEPLFPKESFGAWLATSLVALAVLHITPVKIPTTRGWAYLVVTVYCIGASATLAIRGWS